MAGLLDFSPDQWQALTLLGSGVAAGNAPGGFQAASSLLAEAPARRMKQQLAEMQMEEMRSQIEQRKAAMEKARLDEEFFQRRFGNGAPSQPAMPGQLGSGSFGAFSPPAGQSDIPPVNQGGRLAGISVDELPLFKRRGMDITEAWKLANVPTSMPAGGYAMLPGQAPRYMADPTKGITLDGAGNVARMGGSGNIAELAGEVARAQEAAKAGLDPMKVYNPTTAREEYVPRSQVAGGQRPQGQPMRPQSGPAPTGNFTGDPAAIMEAITQIRDPQERANAMAAFTEQAKRTQGFAQNGFAAGPSAGESAAAAGAKVRAEADARFGAERGNERTKRGDKATDMLTMLTRARTLLESGNPTESGIGALADKTSAFFGRTSQSAQTASALENIAAGLTMNVPRMEGPQGVIDVELYKTNAGRVGDRTAPVQERLAALNEVERLQRKYAGVDQDSPPNEPPKPSAQTFQQLPPASQYKGKVARNPATGQRMRSNGLSWVEEK